MKALTPSAARICDHAVEHFAEHGYDGSSLNEVATLAGMRKASLYAHFANKDALFVCAFERALADETAYVEAGLAQALANNEAPGHWHPLHLAERYASSANLRFVLRTAFLPPGPVRSVVTQGFEAYLERIRQGFCRALCERYGWAPSNNDRLALYGDAYLGIIDGLHVELMYANPASFARRATSLLKVLDDSLYLTSR